MVDEEIKKILLEMGLYSLALACVGNEAEMFKLFKDDFQSLMCVCAEGV